MVYYSNMFKSVWYYNLVKPPLAPPDWVFQPVWLVLYVTIFIAFLLYARKTDKNKKLGYIYFILQLILNFLWTPAFFYLENIKLALVVILLLDVFVVLTIKKFYSISKPSGLILIPYFVWIIFATYLNIGYLF